MRTSSVADTELEGRTLGWVVRRLLLYIGLAFASLTIFALFFALTIRLGVADKINGWSKSGWIGFLVFTALLVWITVRQSRRLWRHWGFWPAIACLLTIHCLVFVAILRIYPDWRVIWFWPIAVVEAGAFGGMLAWLFPERRTKMKGMKSFERARLQGAP